MSMGLVGRKAGMTRLFTDAGESVPVTVIEVEPNRVTQLKTVETDGYSAVQVGTDSVKPQRLNKPESGHLAKAEVPAARTLREFRVEAAELESYSIGGEVTVELFEQGQLVDVAGTSKGKGFAGGVKRHNFSTQDATHGNSLAHRAPGSIGQNQTPGRVFKGKKMAGQMGNKRVTSVSLEVVRVDKERNLLLIKGAVPGAPSGSVIVRPAAKARS